MYFLLTTPLIQFAPIGMDIYDFHVIGNFAGTEMPWMLALLVNLGLASPRASGFTSCGGGSTGVSDPGGSALRRSTWVVVRPVGSAYAVVRVITNASVSIQLAVILTVMVGILACS